MDVGAEAGRFSQFSKTNIAETISLDIDKYGLKRLKHKAKNTNAVQADARKTPVKNETFDVIFMIEVLPEPHVPNTPMVNGVLPVWMMSARVST